VGCGCRLGWFLGFGGGAGSCVWLFGVFGCRGGCMVGVVRSFGWGLLVCGFDAFCRALVGCAN
jgi:hypothetical protein